MVVLFVHRRRGCADLRIAAGFAAASGVGAVLGTVLNRGSHPDAVSPHAPTGTAFWLRLIPAGLAVGVLTGYVGVGGGFLIVPVLTLLLGIRLDRAIGTSLVIIGLTSTVGLAAHLQGGSVNWAVAAPFAAAAAVGSLIGAHYSARTSRERLTRLFAGLVIVIAVALLGTATVGLAS